MWIFITACIAHVADYVLKIDQMIHASSPVNKAGRMIERSLVYRWTFWGTRFEESNNCRLFV